MELSHRPTLSDFFKAYSDRAMKEIKQAADKDLFADTFAKSISETIKSYMPTLDKKNLTFYLSTQLISILNSPSNMYLSGGAEYLECATFKVPILGDINLFKFLTIAITDNATHDDIGYIMSLDANMLICKVISKKKIIGNKEVLHSVNAQAGRCYASIEAILKRSEPTFNTFFVTELVPFIHVEISKEKRNRKAKDAFEAQHLETEMKLNPFQFID